MNAGRGRPIIAGAGPAGCAAAITLAREGVRPLLIDRDRNVGDALCGGFMSWRTAETAKALGIDLERIGAQPVGEMRVFAGSQEVRAPLPAPAYGLSRRAFDTALRERAMAVGAELAVDRVRTIRSGMVAGEDAEYLSDAIVLATGKSDVRGRPRPRTAADPALGIRARLPASEYLARLIGERIELHLFDGGYAGIVRQEDGSANICLALRKSALSKVEGSPRALLDDLARAHPHFGERWSLAPAQLQIEAIGAVPYGYIERETEQGLYRVGDQAAVIPSLAGEGMSIALASGLAAGNACLNGVDAQSFQAEFARTASGPVRRASVIWHVAENPLLAKGAMRFLANVPGIAGLAMRATRIRA